MTLPRASKNKRDGYSSKVLRKDQPHEARLELQRHEQGHEITKAKQQEN